MKQIRIMAHDYESLRSLVRGGVVLPGDANYDNTRKVFNAMIDKKPACFAMCVDVADVINTVNYARDNSLRLSVRGGGHNAGGLGIADDALCLDLSGIKYTRVDTAAKTIRVGGGNTWGEVDHAGHAYGLAVPTGIISTTGVGGLATGGGLGHLSRAFGLTIDNFLEVDMVLADGSFVTASANQHPDLFWAVRGGGGNFGVVTSFLFQAHDVHTIIGGPTFWELDRSAEILKWYRDFIVSAPRELNGFFAFLTVPPAPPFPDFIQGKEVCAVVWAYTGDHDKFDEIFADVRATNPWMDGTQPLPFPALNSIFDQFFPTGDNWYWRADFVNEISDDAVAEHVKHANKMPTGQSTMHLYPINGKCHDVGQNDTPWAYRNSNWAQVMVGVDNDPANNEKITKWSKDYFDGMHPYSAGGAYVNFMMEEGQDRVRATYGENYDRLAEIKAKYDPDNFFRINQNIYPKKS
jgi:FAD/FMN-containing dehydrogenase